MADKQTVKVGDKVRSKYSCHNGGYDIGDVFTVTKVDGEFIEFVDKDGSDRLRSSDEFDILPVADTTGKPAFKVGDRVRVLSDYSPWASADEVGLVQAVDVCDRDCLVKFGTGRMGDHTWYVRWDNLELAPSLTIETGKFYRTRDGRKVGPAYRYHDGWSMGSEGGNMWANDGYRYFGNAPETDLIAEWDDEPASNDNATPTKPAIVALIKSGQPKPSEKPKVHKSEQSATDEAERLAVKYPGQKFGVFVLADLRIADVVIRRAA
ncbi:hypothetical protein OHI65_06980 [Brucella sp. MAB-22]|uniref:hypothetical protein n=1 Tax=Brucella sp. MAB-22 TaxID=2986424 RepID=UPI00221EC438|nr:hypothetical protein [Brucella sp. MAB-22]UYT54117.1 hypothetical protein OHI65_06980 [Brucella sp. MAB-22]